MVDGSIAEEKARGLVYLPSGLRPWLQDLTESEQQHFLTRYHQMLEEQYPLQENGQILLAFPRLFIVARRTE